MATQWFYKDSVSTVGPISARELLKRVRERTVTAQTLVRKNDSKWFPAVEVNGLMEAAFRGEDDETMRRESDTEYQDDY
jgi:hypothetical protein